FVHDRHGMEIGEAIARAGIRKRYYLETRGDVLLRNKEVFRLWQRLGLKTMFLGLEAIDEAGLRKYRKRVSLGRNFEAVEFGRALAARDGERVTPPGRIYRRRLDGRRLWDVSGIAARLLRRGQTNFVKSLFSLNRVYRPELLLADHAARVVYAIPLPPKAADE